MSNMIDVNQLAKALAQLTKDATGTPVGPTVHGDGGLFGVSGLERDVISSRMAPRGLASAIPVVGDVTMDPLFPYITGYTDVTGNAVTSECGNGQTAGSMKTVLQTADFGLVKFRTREMNIALQGNLINRGEFTDLRFVNDPLAEQLAGFLPSVDTSEALMYGREVLTRFVDVGVAFQNYHMQTIWTGTGLNFQYPGLERLVVENHYDAKTGQLAPALQSDVRDFGSVDISTAAGAAAIVTTLTSMWRHANFNASRMGFGNVQFVWVMKHQLFTEITDIWPCAYMTDRCVMDTSSDKRVFVNADDQVALRVAMRQGNYLLIDDIAVPVITDDGLTETEVNNTTLTYESDIYLLPLTIGSGRPVLYWQHFDYSRGTVPAIRDGRAESVYWTDRGRYLWYREPIYNGCVIWQAENRMRVILETPQLAARLQNVDYSVSKHFRDTIPGQAYYLDGGVTGYTADTLYNQWSNIPS